MGEESENEKRDNQKDYSIFLIDVTAVIWIFIYLLSATGLQSNG